ncbi:hypothetical protein Ptr902_13569 [Pyrenophora tritici-repentis]|nr:hypothetical protein Ptr902_13569 [Pyrenophora tritici-repentis]
MENDRFPTSSPKMKSKKDKSKKLSKTETNGHAQVEETNGKSAAKKAAKAAKEALKTAAAADTEDEEAVKAAKKAARKAEKKRAKALAKGEEVTEPTPSSKPTPVAAIVEPASRARRSPSQDTMKRARN